MLVLARRTNDKVCFPSLGILVEVLRISGNTVRLGIKAPASIKVLRHELATFDDLDNVTNPVEDRLGKLTHDMRNRLNTATLALHLMQKQTQAGLLVEAETSLQRALREFQSLDQELGAAKSQPRVEERLRHRALLVEDDPNERELLSGILRMNGFIVDTASDGLDAMGYLNQHEQPDLVLMDMRMPRLDGPTTVSAIRGTPDYSGLKLFAVSATDPGELGVSTGPQGVDRWFPKPLNPSAFVAELSRECAAGRN